MLMDEGISTSVEAEAHCFSACALIFMAGTNYGESSQFPKRSLHILGTLGFHAPYLTVRNGNFNSDVLNAAYREGVSAIGQILKLEPRRPPVDYFPKELVAELTQYGPDQIYNVDTVGKAIRFNIDIIGLPEPHSLTSYSVDQLCAACDNMEWSLGQIGKCEPKSMQRTISANRLETKYSFLNYGGEEGGLRCDISAGFYGSAYGEHKVMHWSIEGRDLEPKFFFNENTILRTIANSTAKAGK